MAIDIYCNCNIDYKQFKLDHTNTAQPNSKTVLGERSLQDYALAHLPSTKSLSVSLYIVIKSQICQKIASVQRITDAY